MSPLYTLLHTPGFYLLSVCITLQVCAQIVLCAMVLYRNRKPSILMSNLVLLALSMFLFILLLEGLMPFLPSLKGRNIPVTYFFTLPWWPVALLTCVLWCMTIFGYFGQQRYARRHLSFSSIKEALDQLPEGFCFATDDGTVLLANLSINAYCQECTGHPLVQANTFWDTLLAQGEMHEEQLLLTMQSGHTLSFRRSREHIDGKEFTRITASDITSLYQHTLELRARQQSLKTYQQRMMAMRTQVTQVIASQELLSARTAVHDELGSLLLKGRYVLENPSQENRTRLLQELKNNTDLLLRMSDEEESQETSLDAAMAKAQSMGVQVELKGELPTSATALRILVLAIHECAANTVKHAGGHSLTVHSKLRDRFWEVTLLNDGQLPTEPIHESGGLRSLRSMTEISGGSMRILYKPAFHIRLRLPAVISHVSPPRP